MSTLSESMEQRGEEVNIRRILVPIDGSNCSMRAARYAIEVAKLQRAEILCIHIIQKLPYSYEFTGSVIEQYIKDIKNRSQEWFDKIVKIAKNEGIENIKTEVIMDVRSIPDTIINYASDKSADLIILGTKGRTGLQRVLLGSVANNVLQHSHCTVMVVR